MPRDKNGDEIIDLAGRTRIERVLCSECPWRGGCPDACKRGSADARPAKPWVQS